MKQDQPDRFSTFNMLVHAIAAVKACASQRLQVMRPKSQKPVWSKDRPVKMGGGKQLALTVDMICKAEDII